MTRLLTIVVLVVVAGFTCIRGYRVIGFVQAQSDPSTGGGSAISAWQSAPGLSGDALEASLARMTQSKDRERADTLAELLAIRPLSPNSWLSLAGLRVALGEREAQVDEALTMSELTGPNEAEIMFQRGIFGLLRWDLLPERAHERAIRDLAGALHDDAASEGGLDVLKGVIASEPPETRTRIAAELQGNQLSAKQLERIGL